MKNIDINEPAVLLSLIFRLRILR